MINKIAVSKPRSFPMILKYTDLRSYVLTLVFIVCDVFVPWLFHQFHLAGPTFLPMHIFVLLAGLMFGWRTGLIVGLVTPVASYLVSGMPVLAILPQNIIELSMYGLAAGVLREKAHLRVIWSLLGAMASGRLALGLAATVTYLVTGVARSPLGSEANPLMVVWTVTKQGWPGIAIQLFLIPPAIWLVGRLLRQAKKNSKT